MQLRLLIMALVTPLVLGACSVHHKALPAEAVIAEDEAVEAILTVLKDQQVAWNRGDIDGFMEGYWQSPDLRFASGGTITTGWEETLARYKARYSNRAIMGTLEFSDLDVRVLSLDDAVVHGAWALQRAKDRPSGLFTLVLARIDGAWKVVSDTTTSAD